VYFSELNDSGMINPRNEMQVLATFKKDIQLRRDYLRDNHKTSNGIIFFYISRYSYVFILIYLCLFLFMFIFIPLFRLNANSVIEGIVGEFYSEQIRLANKMLVLISNTCQAFCVPANNIPKQVYRIYFLSSHISFFSLSSFQYPHHLVIYFHLLTLSIQIPLSTDEKSLSIFYEWLNKGGVDFNKVSNWGRREKGGKTDKSGEGGKVEGG
jgi:hypothetical protein